MRLVLPGPRLPAACAQQYQPLKPSRAGNGTIASPLGTIKNDVQTTTWRKPCAAPFILYSTHKPGPPSRTPSRPANTRPPHSKKTAQNTPPKRSRDDVREAIPMSIQEQNSRGRHTDSTPDSCRRTRKKNSRQHQF